MNRHLRNLVEIAIGISDSDHSTTLAERGEYQLDWNKLNREYDIFISYRRNNGSEIARVLVEKLNKKGYRVFLDTDSLTSGEWNKQLSSRIEECPDFIAIITDGYFDRCENPNDVVRQEISHALSINARVVPFLVSNTNIPQPLPDEISGILTHNGVSYFHEYSDQAIEKVCKLLRSTPLYGPSRLTTGETQPRIILFCVLVVTGTWSGAYIGEDALRYYQGNVFLDSLIIVLFVLLPILIILNFYCKKQRLRPDLFYLDSWIPFWSSLVLMMSIITSTFVVNILPFITDYSFILGGYLGAFFAVPMTRLIIDGYKWKVAKDGL